MILANKVIEPSIIIKFKDWLAESTDFSANGVLFFKTLILIAAIAIACVLANFITRKIILAIVHRMVRKSKTEWDDILLEKKVFNNLSHLVPGLIIYHLAIYALYEFPGWTEVVKTASVLYMIIVGYAVSNSFLNAIEAIYRTLPSSKNKSIKSYLQIVRILLIVIGLILLGSILFGKNPLNIIAGLGVFVTALMFLFKDTLLGLIGGIQLSSNDMVRIGDWISMPSREADGVVTDITLNTVKVQNWDKTVTTIPTYSLVSESFKNWRGMEESGGRRICRNILLDISSIKFCDENMLAKFRKIRHLEKYISEKSIELKKWNDENGIDDSVLVNGHRMTNVGTFRYYIEQYLKHNPNIHTEGMTFLVRQLEPTEKGLPMQIYVFSKVQEWVKYEAVQADIFDHILAVVPEFELRIFQNPSGGDFRKIIS